MDPSNLANWSGRISKRLEKLVEMGYLDTAAQDLTETYVTDIMCIDGGLGGAPEADEEGSNE